MATNGARGGGMTMPSGLGFGGPGGFTSFVQRRLLEGLGIVLMLAGFAYLLALLTANGTDPSFNRATDASVANVLGGPGAVFSDFVLQGLGLAALVPPAALLAWGVALLRDHFIGRMWLKLLLLPVTSLLLATAFAALPGTGEWPWIAGLGGLAGHMILVGSGGTSGLGGFVAQFAGGVDFALISRLLAMACLAAGLVALYHSLGIGLGGYVRFGRGVARMGRNMGEVIDRGRSGIGGGGFKLRLPTFGRRADSEAPRDNARREPRFGNDGNERGRVAIEIPSRVAEAEERGRGERLVVTPTAKAKEKAKPTKSKDSRQAKLVLEESAFELPPVDILSRPTANLAVQRINEESLEKNARLLETVLDDFGVKGEIVKVRPGPVVTLYELEPAPGTKTSRVVSLADDVARSMSAVSVRIAVVPGRSVIGIELPNREREVVAFRELIEDESYQGSQSRLALVLGKDIGGAPIVVDLARMPHLLIAGTTGSGKSVAINTMILSLLYRLTPEQCKFIMIDPKMLELSVYDGIPHLLSPVVTEPKKAIVALKWVVREMENRYRAMSRLGVRNIDGFNQRLEQARAAGETLTRRVQTGFDPESGQPIYEEEPFDLTALPFIVVVVDEMADLMLVAGKEIEAAIQRLAQMARAAGIHIIMATQRPSVDVITGTIKANFPTRISFHVTTKIDSRTILGEMGAEQLLGQGDMLYMANGGRITRVHGPFVSDREVESIVRFLKEQGEPAYIEEVTQDDEEGEGLDNIDGEPGGGSGDELYDRAVAIVTREKKASVSFVQRHLQIGYNRAARIVERMEKEGVVSQANHVGKREVLARGMDD
ncbi:DNA translocase FtsK [Dongia rigui]|uniref:DNA translocase FtsK n=1 Tax=Dongia rigui TaxID=940149 RepID=A0ABU5E1W3_9PROT|nr:DNA translocase FtsK 4TM domain-containing protein [Dongia rigui]MDY0873489.1 DNA translocase FtsK 4TM domain-containing protein [Dongia rigui]